MIDTSLLIDYFRKTDKSNARLVQLSQQFDQLAISSVTEFEVYSGGDIISDALLERVAF